jgi:uncharacterized protein YjbI with pentapeptide repeats
MANPEHVEIVERGVKAIAQWRQNHTDERLVLSDIDLREADLRGADLFQGNLIGTDLRRAALLEANLSEADLGLADLSAADLRGADLSRANLTAADLSGADLNGADLSRANLTDANLDKCNLESVVLRKTVLGGVDLSAAKGLQTVRHDGPSVIDERTLRKSWPLSEAFLRGCGLSDEAIAFYKATLGKAIEFYSCFISYSSQDNDFAHRLHADLQDNGVRCWFAPEDLKIGDRFRVRIDESIRLHDKLLLLLSEQSVGSQWVEQEVETALEKERKAKERGEERTVLFPIRLDDAVMEIEGGWPALVRRTRHIGDFTRWKDHDAYRASFERLLLDLKAGE